MKNLKRLVLYREKRYSDRLVDKPSLDENKYVLSEKLAEEIAQYLESGLILLEFVSPTTDPYNEQDEIRFAILTDGVYLWDWIIINWIRKYRVRLPDDFLNYFERVKKHPEDRSQLDLDDIMDQVEFAEDIFIEPVNKTM